MTDEEAIRRLELNLCEGAATCECCAVTLHALVALADRKALCVEQSGHALYDATIAARRHMEGQ
jgi:hypothetical protein